MGIGRQKRMRFDDFTLDGELNYDDIDESDLFELAVIEDMQNASPIDKMIEYLISQVDSLPEVIVNNKEYIKKSTVLEIIKNM